MIRARIWVDGRLVGGLQALLGAPMAAYSGCGEGDGGIGHGKRRSRTGLARVYGDVGLAGGSVADGRRQAGNGMARSRARARLNCSSQGQRRGRCRVNRRAERVRRDGCTDKTPACINQGQGPLGSCILPSRHSSDASASPYLASRRNGHHHRFLGASCAGCGGSGSARVRASLVRWLLDNSCNSA